MTPERRPLRRAVDHGMAALLPDLDRPGGWLLTIDESPQSYVDLNDPEYLEFEYIQRLAHLVDLTSAAGTPVRALHLGGGAFTLPRYIAATRPGSVQRAVELDAALLDLVRRELPWATVALTVAVGDARLCLEREPAGSADLVVADVFAGARVPAQVTSVEFVAAAARVLGPDGHYAANLADTAPFDFARGQIATVRAVLPHVCLIAEPAVLRGRRFGNIVLVGSRRELPLDALGRALAGDPFPARLVHGDALDRIVDGADPVTDAAATRSPEPPPDAFTLS
ncbi:MAG TPA: fused MFS/spermidine synthase [Mycobacteriales bacterium]|nr:fused MFS/spermidine synthase [Mycobacteriales bacterium]